MSYSGNSINTPRFIISPIYQNEIDRKLDDPDLPEELKTVLKIRDESCSDRVCYRICHKGFDDPIGFCRADKFSETRTVKLYFDMLDSDKDTYLAEESVDAILRTFYHDKDFYFFEIPVSTGNEAKKHLMENLFFKPAGETDGIILYTREKPPVMWGVIYLTLGIAAGLLFGAVFRHILIGLSAGISIALVFGLITDLLARKKRLIARKQKDSGR